MAGLTNVILVAHILVSIILVVVVLMQRSEGGGLGIGGGGGGGGAGGLMTGRGVAGALVRTTIIFGAIFFISSLTLTTISTHNNAQDPNAAPTEEQVGTDAATPEDLGVGDLEDFLNSDADLLDDPLAEPAEQPAETPANPQ